jgi:hypothetical protein
MNPLNTKVVKALIAHGLRVTSDRVHQGSGWLTIGDDQVQDQCTVVFKAGRFDHVTIHSYFPQTFTSAREFIAELDENWDESVPNQQHLTNKGEQQ